MCGADGVSFVESLPRQFAVGKTGLVLVAVQGAPHFRNPGHALYLAGPDTDRRSRPYAPRRSDGPCLTETRLKYIRAAIYGLKTAIDNGQTLTYETLEILTQIRHNTLLCNFAHAYIF